MRAEADCGCTSLARSLGQSQHDPLGWAHISPGLPTDECYPGTTSATDYSVPHLYALVTQITHGEVALIDLTGQFVVDLDAGQPGFNFLPVGAQPTDITSSPEGVASFVGVESNALALPSATMFSQTPTLRSWPACPLPSRPGAMASSWCHRLMAHG
ncbi:MAG: hypothetical protein U0165_06610 [Polyangiaceae bacterium]